MPTYERGDVSLYYEEYGSGFPLVLLAPGGLNSTIDFWGRMPFNPLESYKSEYHVIAMDQRNAGRSRGPLPIDDPWAPTPTINWACSTIWGSTAFWSSAAASAARSS